MSVSIMGAVWPLDIPATDKMVLLCLADSADDHGVTWIAVHAKSKRRDGSPKLDIMKKCSLSERAIQGAIKRLHASGHITREETLGKVCTYTVHPAPTPAADAPRTECAPAADAHPPAADAGKPSLTVNVDREGERAREILASPEFQAFKAMRRQIRKPLNPTGEKRILAKLQNLADAGYPPGAVLEQSTANCWRGVFPIEDEGDGRRSGTNGVGGSRRKPSDIIAAAGERVARMRSGSGEYGLAPATASGDAPRTRPH